MKEYKNKYKQRGMDMSKVQTLDECLSNIQTIEKACKDRYKEPACKNLRTFYLERCYNKFDKKINDKLDYNKFESNSTWSGVNTLGGNTLNRIIKSPSPPSL